MLRRAWALVGACERLSALVNARACMQAGLQACLQIHQRNPAVCCGLPGSKKTDRTVFPGYWRVLALMEPEHEQVCTAQEKRPVACSEVVWRLLTAQVVEAARQAAHSSVWWRKERHRQPRQTGPRTPQRAERRLSVLCTFFSFFSPKDTQTHRHSDRRWFPVRGFFIRIFLGHSD